MDGLTPGTLSAMYAEIEGKLETVSGLRVGKWGEKPNPPGAYLLLPQSVERMTGRSIRVDDVQIVVLAGRAVQRAALDEILRLTGEVADAIDPAAWTTMSDLTISRIEYDTVTVSGASEAYLAAFFHVDISGA